MASLLASTSSVNSRDTTTTSAIDTTGATLIVVHVSHFVAVTVSDSQSNTWTALTSRDAGNPRSTILYCLSPTTSATHTFTAATSNTFPSCHVMAFDGDFSYASEAGATVTGTSLQPGSITPATGDLLVAGLAVDAASASEAISSPYTLETQRGFVTGQNMGGYFAYLLAPDATARNPTWTGSSVQRAATHARFLLAAPAQDEIDATDSNILYSPGNWRTSGTSKITNNPGAYLRYGFTGTSTGLVLDHSALVSASIASGNYPAIEYRIDGGSWSRAQPTTATVSLAGGLADTSHTCEVVFDAVPWNTYDRWTTPVAAVVLDGILVDSGEGLEAVTPRPNKLLVIGDSHSEGHEVIAATVNVANQSARRAFPWLLAEELNAEVGVVGFAGQGYTDPGGGNVPDAEDSWDFYSNSQSRLVSGEFPDAYDWIFVCHGDNDETSSAPVTAAATAVLTGIKAAAGTAVVYGVQAPNAEADESVESAAATSAVNYIGDGTDILNAGGNRNGNHLSAAGQAAYAALILSGMGDPTPLPAIAHHYRQLMTA